MLFAAGHDARDVVVVRLGSEDVVSEGVVDVADELEEDDDDDDELDLSLLQTHISIREHCSSKMETGTYSDDSAESPDDDFPCDAPTPAPTPTATATSNNTTASRIQNVLLLSPHFLSLLGSGAGGAT